MQTITTKIQILFQEMEAGFQSINNFKQQHLKGILHKNNKWDHLLFKFLQIVCKTVIYTIQDLLKMIILRICNVNNMENKLKKYV